MYIKSKRTLENGAVSLVIYKGGKGAVTGASWKHPSSTFMMQSNRRDDPSTDSLLNGTQHSAINDSNEGDRQGVGRLHVNQICRNRCNYPALKKPFANVASAYICTSIRELPARKYNDGLGPGDGNGVLGGQVKRTICKYRCLLEIHNL